MSIHHATFSTHFTRSLVALAFALAPPLLLALPAAGSAQTTTTNTSSSGAVSDSASHSAAVSLSTQGQTAQQANGQSIVLNQAQPLSTTRLIDKVVGSNAVPLAAAVSFSSDSCASVGSAGASAFGVSIGGAGAINDENCRSLRRAEKFSVLAVTASNMKMLDWAGKLMSLSIFEMCSSNPKTQTACEKVALMPAVAAQQQVARNASSGSAAQ